MTSLVVRGLVLREAGYGESSKMLTVLTDAKGKLSVSAKGALRKNSRIAAASQLFAFSEMTLGESRDRYYLNDASTIELFDGLKADLRAYSLGAYFLELLDAACQEEAEEPEALTLALNALWLLSAGKKSLGLIKSVFELRLMCLLGYMPETSACSGCGSGLEGASASFIDLRGGELYCPDCASKRAARPRLLCAASLAAIRHITGSAPEKAFSFSIRGEAEKRLSQACEDYAAERLERTFPALEYYKKTLK